MHWTTGAVIASQRGVQRVVSLIGHTALTREHLNSTIIALFGVPFIFAIAISMNHTGQGC